MGFIKNIILYLIVFIFILGLTSSFIIENIIEDSDEFNLSSDKMYKIYSEITSEKNSTQNTLPENNNGVKVEEDSNDNIIDDITEYSLGESNEEIIEYKKILYYLDFTEYVSDGIFDETTQEAILKYQEQRNLSVTGILDRNTIISLNEEQIEYKKGKRGDEILKYQLILYYLDYFSVYPKGYYGNITESAVKEYQTDKKITVNGIINSETIKELEKEIIIYKKGKSGIEIKNYQQILIDMGLLDGSATGEFGNMTKNAVELFQKANALEVTGEINIETQEAFNKYINN